MGFPRLWEHMILRFLSGDIVGAKKFAREVMGGCEICQACKWPHTLKAPIKSTPIPPAPMASVRIDLFSLPP